MGLWYWRLRAANGLITADGGYGYTRRRDCVRAVRRNITTAQTPLLVFIDKNGKVIHEQP